MAVRAVDETASGKSRGLDPELSPYPLGAAPAGRGGDGVVPLGHVFVRQSAPRNCERCRRGWFRAIIMRIFSHLRIEPELTEPFADDPLLAAALDLGDAARVRLLLENEPCALWPTSNCCCWMYSSGTTGRDRGLSPDVGTCTRLGSAPPTWDTCTSSRSMAGGLPGSARRRSVRVGRPPLGRVQGSPPAGGRDGVRCGCAIRVTVMCWVCQDGPAPLHGRPGPRLSRPSPGGR